MTSEAMSDGPETRLRVMIALLVTAAAAMIERIGAREGGSLFLEADAAHMMAHLGILGLLLMRSGRSPAAREARATVGVLLVLLAVAVWIGVKSVRSLQSGAGDPRPAAMLLSVVGLAANLFCASLLRDPARTRGSFLVALVHELSDASLTLAGLLGVFAVWRFHWRWVDPALSLVIVAWLLVWSMRRLVALARQGSGPARA